MKFPHTEVKHMQYNKESFSTYYGEMSRSLREYKLPRWEDFPDIEIYMDQLVVLMNRYLSLPDGGEGRGITASMINNYVKMRIMPSPVRKKYGRSHLAYLVIICLLKDALGTAAIQKVFPPGMEEPLLQERYNAFIKNQTKACHFVADNVDRIAIPLLQEQERISERIYDLVMQTCVSASITKLLAERFIAQQSEPAPPPEETEE